MFLALAAGLWRESASLASSPPTSFSILRVYSIWRPSVCRRYHVRIVLAHKASSCAICSTYIYGAQGVHIRHGVTMKCALAAQCTMGRCKV